MIKSVLFLLVVFFSLKIINFDFSNGVHDMFFWMYAILIFSAVLILGGNND